MGLNNFTVDYTMGSGKYWVDYLKLWNSKIITLFLLCVSISIAYGANPSVSNTISANLNLSSVYYNSYSQVLASVSLDMHANVVVVNITKPYGSIPGIAVGKSIYYQVSSTNSSTEYIYNVTITKAILKMPISLRFNNHNFTYINPGTNSSINILISNFQKNGDNILLNNSPMAVFPSLHANSSNELEYYYNVNAEGVTSNRANINGTNISLQLPEYKLSPGQSITVQFDTPGNANYTAIDPTVTFTSANTNEVISTSTTLGSNLACGNLTINSGVTLTTNGYDIYCESNVINYGNIIGGYDPTSVYLGAGLGYPNSYAGSGGGGGYFGEPGGNTLVPGGAAAPGGGSGSLGSTPSPPTLSTSLIQTWYASNVLNYVSGAGGGSSGGCGCSNDGPGGDGTYGILIEANNINAGTINTTGQPGGMGYSGNGGGGGGGGGLVILAYNSVYASGSYTYGGGIGGSGCGGCNGGGGGGGNVMTFQWATPPINVVPELLIFLSPSTASVIAGQSVLFTNTTTGGGPLPYSFTYNVFQFGVPAATANYVLTGNSIKFNVEGTYNVLESATDNSGYTAYSANSVVTVNTLTISITSSANIVYTGQVIKFVNTTSGGTPPYSFTYNVLQFGVPANTANYSITGNSIDFAASGVYDVIEKVTDHFGTSASGSSVITVNAFPIYVDLNPANANMVISTSTTLSSDIVCGNLTIDSGVTLTTNGYNIYCQSNIINYGTIFTGYDPTSVYLGAGLGYPNSYAGSGGGGGFFGEPGGNTLAPGGAAAQGAGTGSFGLSPDSPILSINLIRIWYNANIINYLSGAGGGSGGGCGCSDDGPGGDSTYGVLIEANNINAGTINTNGGNGGDGTSGNGGGGGGGAGVAILAYNAIYTSGAYSYSGGSGGFGCGGCGGGSGGNGNVLTFQWATPPVIVVSGLSISLSPTSNTITTGVSVKFTNTTMGGAAPYTHSYSVFQYGTTAQSGNYVITGNSIEFLNTQSSSAQTFNVLESVTDNSGTTAYSSNSVITVNSPPTIALSPTTNTINSLQSVKFTNTTSGGTPPYTFAYSVFQYGSAASPSNFIINGNSIEFTNAGTYNVLEGVTDAFGITAYSANSQISVNIALPRNIIAYLPITLLNYQSSAIAANTPIAIGTSNTFTGNIIGFNAIEYEQYETCNLNNAEFFLSNGVVLNSWLEGNLINEEAYNSMCTSSSSANALSGSANVLYWVEYSWPSSFLPANSGSNPASNTIYIGWAGNVLTSSNNLLTNTIDGEAPQLSCGDSGKITNTLSCNGAYGQYDTGNVVFGANGLYQNFAGSSTPSGWANTGSAFIGNEVVITKTEKQSVLTSATYNGFGTANVFEGLIRVTGAPTTAGWADFGLVSTATASCATKVCWILTGKTAGEILPEQAGKFGSAVTSNAIYNAWNVYSVYESTSKLGLFYYDYGNSNTVASTTAFVSDNFGVGSVSTGSVTNETMQWARIRQNPPNNDLPGTAYGTPI